MATRKSRRVLFVESDPACLAEIRQTLETRRPDWSATMVGSAAEGLLACHQEPFDVVVAALELPGTSGTGLLEAIAEQWPGTLRVVLADRADESGSRLLKSLALVHGAFATAEGTPLPLEYDLRAEQAHGSAVAALARRLAGPARGDGAFSAGLLHDIGRLLLAVRAPDQFSEVANYARRSELPMLEAERAVLGVDHAALGAYLLAGWGLPPVIVSAVRYHHAPLMEADRRGFAVFIHLANGLIRETEQPGAAAAPSLPTVMSGLFPPLLDAEAVGVACDGEELLEWRNVVERAVA